MAANYQAQTHTFHEVIAGLLGPWQFMWLSVTHLPATVLPLVKTLSLGTLFSWSRLQPLWFAHFWSVAGPQVREGCTPSVIPLLSGCVRNGEPVPASEAPSPGVGGTVLEIGPGSGMWVSMFSASHNPTDITVPARGQRSRITRIYGVEPNPAVHDALRAEVAAADLQDVYEIVPLGIQDALASGRIAPESIDCIVSVLCLCSIPDPAKNIAELYRCLKPGGRWYVLEHVRSFPEQGWAMNMYQAFVNIFWPLCIGGCNIRRDTVRHLKESGPWASIDLAEPPQEHWFLTLPHVYGILTKQVLAGFCAKPPVSL